MATQMSIIQQPQQMAPEEQPIASKHKGLKWWGRRIAFGPKAQEYDYFEHNRTYMRVYMESRRIMAEFLGTYFLVLCIAGIGVIDMNSPTGDVNLLARGALGGLTLAGLIYLFGGISGAHFNPIVTCAFFMRGFFNFFRMIEYWIAQFAGGILAAATIRWMFGNVFLLGATAPSRYSNGVSVGMEIVISCLLILAVLATAEKAVLMGPITSIFVGTIFAATQIFGWNVSGASVNPFRSLCPALVSGNGLKTIWIYFVGPIAGMFIAVGINRFSTIATMKESVVVVKGDPITLYEKREDHLPEEEMVKDLAMRIIPQESQESQEHSLA